MPPSSLLCDCQHFSLPYPSLILPHPDLVTYHQVAAAAATPFTSAANAASSAAHMTGEMLGNAASTVIITICYSITMGTDDGECGFNIH